MFADDKIKDYLHQLEQQGLLRNRLVLEPIESPLVHFDSNDYLSLTQDKRVSEGYQRGYALYPSGSGASMLLSGYHANHRAVERAFAKLLAVDECILLSSGYAANLAVTSLFAKLNMHAYIDKEVHASVYDGLAIAQGHYTRYFHNDVADIARKMIMHSKNSVLMTEGIFSMSGQISPLDTIAALCQKNQTDLVVDEAHSFGVMGKEGMGSVAYHGLNQNEVPLRVIPLGKAFAAQGALAHHEDPTLASRPLDKERNGIAISEGGCVYVLERLSDAKARGAKIYAEIAGYAINSDATDFVNPNSERQV